jgi:hypothetical protein
MYHLDTKNLGKGAYYSKDWLGKYCPSVGELEKLILKYAYSPCMWAGGERKKVNFRHAEWIALDFDAGPSLKAISKVFKEYVHIVATTKSHQVKKENGSIGDRFRVILKLSEAIYHGPTYENTVTHYIEKYGADAACKDSSRFFWPSVKIIQSAYFGQVIEPLVPKRKSRKYNDWLKKNAAHYKKNGVLPANVALYLERGSNLGRNKTSYCIAKDLAKLGYTVEQTVYLIMSSAIPNCGDHVFTETECKRAVVSAFGEK